MSSIFWNPNPFPRDFCSSFTVSEETSMNVLGTTGMGFSKNFCDQAYFHFALYSFDF